MILRYTERTFNGCRCTEVDRAVHVIGFAFKHCNLFYFKKDAFNYLVLAKDSRGRFVYDCNV